MKRRVSNPRKVNPPGREATAVRAWPSWPVALVLGLLALLAYSNIYGNPFLMDDVEGIVENEFVRSLSPLSRAMSAPPQSVAAGRPLLALSLALNYAWGGLDPSAYHAVNVLVHWAAALALFGCIRRALLLPGMPAALSRAASPFAAAAAALWMLHPLQAEVMNYVVQRSESMMGLWFLLTLYTSIRVMTAATPAEARGWTIAAVAVCACGMATKEAMATAPVIVCLFDVVFVAGSLGRALRERPALYGGLVATWGLLFALVAGGPRSHSAGFGSGVSPATYLMNQAVVVATYFKLSLLPYPLVADYGRTQAIAFSQAAAPGLLVLLLLALTAYALWKVPRLGFLGAWIFIILAPSSSIVPIATEVGAERRMYLPLAAIVVLLLFGLTRLLRGREGLNTSNERMALIVAGVAVAICGVTTYARNRDYADPVVLWTDVIQHRPHGRAHYSLAQALKARGEHQRAMEEYRRAAVDEFAAHYAIGFELDAQGRTAEAVEEYRAFIRAAGGDYRVPNTWVLVGWGLMTLGAPRDAESAFRTALGMRPRHADALAGLADALLAQERFAEAVTTYQAYVQVAPGNAAAFANMGRAFVGLDKPPEAVDAFARAVALSPDDPMARMNYGDSLMGIGDPRRAAEQYRAALAAAPASVRVLGALATALAALGERQEAEALFRRALSLAPGDPQTLADYRAIFGPPVR